MRNMNILKTIIICSSFLLITNCEDILDDSVVSPEDSTAAVQLVNDANAQLLPILTSLFSVDPDSAQDVMEGLELSSTLSLYDQARLLDWRNQEANLGYGITATLRVSQLAIATDIFGNTVKTFAPFSSGDMETSVLSYGFALPLTGPRLQQLMSTYFQLPLNLARMNFQSLGELHFVQESVRNEYLPLVETGIAALDSLSNHPEMVFTLSPTLRIDHIDLTALQVSLYGLSGLLKALSAYSFELDNTDAVSITAGLSPGSAFATLQEDGALRLTEAYEAIGMAFETANAAFALLATDAPDLLHPFVNVLPGDAAQVQSTIAGLTPFLSGSTDVEYGFADERGDIELAGTLSMDISKFYLQPYEDLKTLLPEYTTNTSTGHHYTQVTLNQPISHEDASITIEGLDNTPISINISYSESDADTVAHVTIGFLGFNLLTANEGDLPMAIWELWNELLLTIEQYSEEVHNYPEISFQWSGFITTGSSLTIDGFVVVDYLEVTDSFIIPELTWTAVSNEDWLAGFSDPTVNGLFPSFQAVDLAALLGLSW